MVEAQKRSSAERLVSSFVLAPSQAAACERCFSLTVHLRDVLGQQVSPQVIFAYMLVSSYMGPAQTRQTTFCKSAPQNS